jgi:hypothetical protein
VLLSTVVACTHGRLEPAATRIPAPLGRVDVGTAPDLPADRLERYRELDGDRVIREAIESELADGGLFQPDAPAAIAVTVTVFRLRSGVNAFVNGFFAGSDLLDGRIEIRRPDAAPETITFKFSGNEDEYFVLSSAARFRSLARELAREIRARVETSP